MEFFGTFVNRITTSLAKSEADLAIRKADGVQPSITLFATETQYMVAANVVYLSMTFVLYQIMKPREDKKPLNDFLRPFVALYNLTCIFLAGYCAVGIIMHKYNHPGTFMCNALPLQDTGLAWLFWVFYAQKFWEFLDTWIFVLRCSFRQVTVLHLFHHSSIAVVVGSILPYDYGGDMFLPILLNAIVHVLMYSHYLCTIMKIKTWWNQYLTSLQLIQFLLISSQNILSYRAGPECGPPDWAKVLMIAYMGSMVVLFGHFFARKYILGKNDASMCGVVKTNSEISWTIYRGKSTLDKKGEAKIRIPMFQKRHLHTEHHYQLTPIGGAMPNLFVSDEVDNGKFNVGGGMAGKQVSWQVHVADQELEEPKDKKQ